MRRVGTPFNAEWHQVLHSGAPWVLVILGRAQKPPPQGAAIGTRAGAFARRVACEAGLAQAFGDNSKITRMDHPAHQARPGQLWQGMEPGKLGLFGIGCEDFQVTARPERKQGVAGAAPGMDPAQACPHPGPFFDELYTAIEIAHTEDQMVETRGDGHCAVIIR